LIEIDEILIKGGLENQLIDTTIKEWLPEQDEDVLEFINSEAYPRLWK